MPRPHYDTVVLQFISVLPLGIGDTRGSRRQRLLRENKESTTECDDGIIIVVIIAVLGLSVDGTLDRQQSQSWLGRAGGGDKYISR